jgi:hypothetical protein
MSEKADYTAGAQLDKQHMRLGDLTAQMDVAKNSGNAAEEARIRTEMETMVGYQSSDVEAFHASQDAVTNAASTTGGVAATVLLTAATGGLGAAPAAALMMGTAGGGLASMGIKRALQGDAYGREAAGYDAAMTVVNTLSAGALASQAATQNLPAFLAEKGLGTYGVAAGGGFAGSFGNTMATQVAQGIGGGLVSGTAQGLLDEKTWRGPGNGALNVLKAVGSNVAGGVVGGAVQTGAGKLPGLGGDGMAPSLGTGFLGGAAGGAAQVAIDPSTYSGRPEDIAAKFGTTMAPQAVQGGLLNAVQSKAGQRSNPRLEAKLRANQNAAAQPTPPVMTVETNPTVPKVKPPATRDTTPTTNESTPVEKKPTLVEKTPTLAEKTPTLAEKTPTLVEKTPTLVETPTVAEKTPAVVEDATVEQGKITTAKTRKDARAKAKAKKAKRKQREESRRRNRRR